MGLLRKTVSAIIWIVTILAQLAIAFYAGMIAFSMGNGEIPASVLFMWLGTVFGIFIIGTIPLSLRRSLSPKKYLARLTITALGVLYPLAFTATFGYALNADREIIGSGLDFFNFSAVGGFLFIFSAPVLGIIGFYIANWVVTKQIPVQALGVAFLLPLCYLFLLGYVQGYYLPDYNFDYGLDETTVYTINPETILASITHGETDIFVLAPPRSDEEVVQMWSPGSFSWNQEDYLSIANALHQFVWKEPLDGWQIIRASFWMDQCQDMRDRFDTGLFYFYQRQKGSYVVHNIWITPLYSEVETREIIYGYTGKWKSIDLDDVKINSADMALQIAEDSGGIDARKAANEECSRVYIDLVPYTKYDLLSHPFNLYDWGWGVRYWLNDSSDFEVTIDPYTGTRSEQ
ncbi:MAG TPA: hypothetical protein VK206_25970 [Anaerolineales bacterium]|nr:hypothetical protein [Anaerolineales bacterium]